MKKRKFKMAFVGLSLLPLMCVSHKVPVGKGKLSYIQTFQNINSIYEVSSEVYTRLNEKYELKEEELVSNIEKFSRVYNLDEKKMVELFRTKTDYFQFNILTNMSDKDLKKNTFFKVVDIKNNPNEYGIEDMNEYYNFENYEQEMTIREMVNYYSEIYGVEPNFILAIECWESGYYRAPIATRKCNPGALRGRKGFFSYGNLEQGIIDHIRTVKEGYLDKGLTTFASMERIYCGDGTSWARNVNSIYNNLNAGKVTLYDEKSKVYAKSN